MLKGTLNSPLRLIRTRNLYSDGDELSVVYCILNLIEAAIRVLFVSYGTKMLIFV